MHSSERFKLRAAVYLILKRDDTFLLMRRYNTGWADGYYSLPAGHYDGNETIANAMVREANEEIGVSIKAEDLRVVAVMHELSGDEYITFYMTTEKWEGEPVILEPDKCDNLAWFAKNELPSNIISDVEHVLDNYSDQMCFSEFDVREYDKKK